MNQAGSPLSNDQITTVQRAPRNVDGFQLRTEHKVVRHVPATQAGSQPSIDRTSLGQWQAQDMMMMLYRCGVEMRLSQASPTQSMPFQVMLSQAYSVYPQSYYPQSDNTMRTLVDHQIQHSTTFCFKYIFILDCVAVLLPTLRCGSPAILSDSCRG